MLSHTDFLALNHPCFPGINPLHHDILAFLYNLASFCLGFFFVCYSERGVFIIFLYLKSLSGFDIKGNEVP